MTSWTKYGEMVSYDNKSFIGTLSEDRVLFTVKRQLGSHDITSDLKGMLWYIRAILRLEKRIDIEACRRGQPVPKIRFLGQQ